MPELPEMQALAERLEDCHRAAPRSTGVDPLGFSALKTVVPAPESRRRDAVVDAVRRRGKYLLFVTDGDVAVVLHLSQAGRLDIEEPPKRTKPKGAAVRIRFDNDRALLVREHGHERKVAWWVLAAGRRRPARAARARARLGRVRRRCCAPAPTSGGSTRSCATSAPSPASGGATPNDALHRAHVSPYATLA